MTVAPGLPVADADAEVAVASAEGEAGTDDKP